ncbi:MAG: translocation/assembly module TamB domain-containing protein [Massilia sp.]
MALREPPPHQPAGKALPPARARRWPRRLAIAAAITAALAAGLYWYGGREATLQTIARKVANASGGAIVITGVSGSLYGAMHIDHLVFKSADQQIDADNIDINWSPFQYLSKGVAVNKLYVQNLSTRALKESEPAKMPVSLAAPFNLSIGDARLAKVTMFGLGAKTGNELDEVRFKLQGGKQNWTLKDGSAITAAGLVKADGSIAAVRPFKLDATASLTQLKVPAGQKAAQLTLRATGDLTATQLAADGQSGAATGSARLSLAPFETIPLRAMHIEGRDIDPGFFNPALPTARLGLLVDASIDPNRNVSGKVVLDNTGPAGSIDQQRLPLRAMRGTLAGSLSQLDIRDVLVDFGDAGKFTGSGVVARTKADTGLGTAEFVLHTDRLDLKGLHGKLNTTRIAGDIKVANAGDTQMLIATLADRGLKLDARAALENNVLTIEQARLLAGRGSIDVKGSASLLDTRKFKVDASASRFDPAALGDYPEADLNADIHAAGQLNPAWQVGANFTVRPSRLFKQPLSGKGKLDANAEHISNIDASLALGSNTVNLKGDFGGKGEQLAWQVDGRDLSAARSDLYGAVKANGIVSGTMAAPRTTFTVDANGLGWVPASRKLDNGILHASGEAALAPASSSKDGKRSVDVKASGTARKFNPGAFGSPLPGSINGDFAVNGRAGGELRGSLDVKLQDSTLSNAPLWGTAKLTADQRHVGNADVDLHLGPNVLAAKGSFGAPGDVLDWRLDAGALAVLGPGYGGTLKGSGSLAGTLQAPSLKLAMDGQNLRLMGKVSLQTLRATASVGNGKGAADPVASDIELTDFASGETRIASARLQTGGTRAAHTLRLAARADTFDVLTELHGGWSNKVWTGVIDRLENKGRYAMTLAAPASLKLAAPAGSGLGGLAKPELIALGNAVIKLPQGSVTIAALNKNGPRWNSKGSATGVPLNYLTQFSAGMRDNLAGDLTLGADWALDMQAPAKAGGVPALNGGVHVFREKGDLVAGSEFPVVLGLRTLDARADVANGALRMQVDVDGTKAGKARIDATAGMVNGKLGNDSPLKLQATADMGSIAWMAPLTGQAALELDGALKLNLTGAGTVGAPTLNGGVTGDRLAVRWPDQGVKLRNGQLRAQLAGDQLVLQRLSFEGQQGSAVADGNVRFAGGEATMNLKLVADRLEVLSRPDRTVVISGQSTLVRDAKRFSLEGKFKADRALVELAPQGRPTLSDDIVVLGRDKKGLIEKDKAPSLPLNIDVEADLGDSFRLRGMGLDAQLGGAVRVRGAGDRPPRINGTIRIVEGNYAAYGQKLAIDRGVITFNGPYDNPGLNILAVRKRPEGEQLTETNVEAGVEVRGSALAPAAKLVSTPNVPDSEKLAWLVLGHGLEGTSGSETGVLSAAAGALLGGSGKGGGLQSRLANSLGVDELGVSQAKGLESTVVTVGKRISKRTYVSFEQGATTASSLVKLRYKLNPRISLQLQAGTNTAFDVLYSWAFD